MDIKTILVPTDFSDYAAHAYQWALGVAAVCNAHVVLFHATPSIRALVYPEGIYYVDLDKMERDQIAEAEKQLKEFAGKKGSSTVAVETSISAGEAIWEICKVAGQTHADLIVMGSHGRTGLSHVFLGSVAERVVRHAPCPVLVVRLPKQ